MIDLDCTIHVIRLNEAFSDIHILFNLLIIKAFYGYYRRGDDRIISQ